MNGLKVSLSTLKKWVDFHCRDINTENVVTVVGPDGDLWYLDSIQTYQRGGKQRTRLTLGNPVPSKDCY
jgi:hypothetical protein